jgi:hypothetical protein
MVVHGRVGDFIDLGYDFVIATACREDSQQDNQCPDD